MSSIFLLRFCARNIRCENKMILKKFTYDFLSPTVSPRPESTSVRKQPKAQIQNITGNKTFQCNIGLLITLKDRKGIFTSGS